MKKFLSLLLSVALVVGVCGSALAASPIRWLTTGDTAAKVIESGDRIVAAIDEKFDIDLNVEYVPEGSVEKVNVAMASGDFPDIVTGAYGTTATLTPDTTVEIPLSSLSISPTLLCPAPYPVFLQRQLMPEGYDKPLDVSDIERLQFSFPGSEAEIELIGAWLE